MRTPDPLQPQDSAADAKAEEEPLTPETVSRLFLEHNRALIGYLTARLRSEPEAREVAQEAYVRLLQLHKQGTPSLFRAYLFKTATNLAIDRLRRRTVRDRVEVVDLFQGLNEPAPDNADPQNQALAEEQTRRLLQYLSELPRKCQDVFRLHRLDELSQQEVAAKLGLSERMVRRYVTYTMIYCRLRLNGWPIDRVKREVIL
jgi:RNA polymerase sigma factor (sigma-70 family)